MRSKPIVLRGTKLLLAFACCAGTARMAAGWGAVAPSGAAPNNASQQPAGSQRGPMFHGQQLSFPSLPFSRKKTLQQQQQQRGNQVAARTSAPYGHGNAPGRMTGQPMPQGQASGGRMPMLAQTPNHMGYTLQPRTPSQQLMTPDPRAAQIAAMQRAQAGLPPQTAPRWGNPPIDQTAAAMPAAGQRPTATSGMPNARSAMPMAAMPTAAAPSRRSPNAPAANAPIASSRIAAAPTRTAPRASAPQTIQPAAATQPAPTATQTAEASPADALIVEAHQLSTSLPEGAGTEADFTKIIDICRRARQSKPSPEAARFASDLASWAFNRRGELRAEAGRDDEALRDFENSLRADSKRWRAIHNRGVLRAQAGNLEQAFDDFNQTIQLNPEYAKAYSNRAALCVIANNFEPAQADYARAIELDPKLAVAHRGLGRVCHLLGQLDESADHYQQAVELAQDDAFAASCYGDLLVDLGRYAEARDQYERAIELDPQSSQAYSGSAWLLATCPESSIRHHDLALARASKAIELVGEQDPICLDALAAAQASAGDFTAAVGTIRQAVQIAGADERKSYEQRLLLYQHARPYRIAPQGAVRQASYEKPTGNQSAESWE